MLFRSALLAALPLSPRAPRPALPPFHTVALSLFRTFAHRSWLQGDAEAAVGLPVAPMNDRGRRLSAKAQCGFLEARVFFYLVPCFLFFCRPRRSAASSRCETAFIYYFELLHFSLEAPPHQCGRPAVFVVEVKASSFSSSFSSSLGLPLTRSQEIGKAANLSSPSHP